MTENLQRYLKNNNLLLSEQYFFKFLNEIDKPDKLLKNYIDKNNNTNNNLLEKVNYHLFYIHYFNNLYNNFLKEIDKEIDKKINYENNIILENYILQIKLEKKLIPFNLMYKIFFNEHYNL